MRNASFTPNRAGRRPRSSCLCRVASNTSSGENYDIGPAPVKIVPNAADRTLFKPIPEAQRLAWRSENGIDAKDIVLIFAGGEWVRKGLDLAIRALALVPDRRAKLFIAGDDPAKETLKALASESGVSDRVVLGGFGKMCRSLSQTRTLPFSQLV